LAFIQPGGRDKKKETVKPDTSVQEQEVTAGNELLFNINIDFYLLQSF
jgi:hypothetical protein